jgi:hypothetical protein
MGDDQAVDSVVVLWALDQEDDGIGCWGYVVAGSRLAAPPEEDEV